MTADEAAQVFAKHRTAEQAHAAATEAVAKLENKLATLTIPASRGATRPLEIIEAQLEKARAELAKLQGEQAAAAEKEENAAKLANERRAHLATLESFEDAYPNNITISQPEKPDAPHAPDFRAYDEAIRAHDDTKRALEKARQLAQEADICPHCGSNREHWSRQHASHEAPTADQMAALITAENMAAQRRSKLEQQASDYEEAKIEHDRAVKIYEAAVRDWNDYSLAESRARVAAEALKRLGDDFTTGDEAQRLAEELDSAEVLIADLEDEQAAAKTNLEIQAAKDEQAVLEESLAWAKDELEQAAAAATAANAAAAAALEATRAASAAAEREKQATAQRTEAEKADKEASEAAVAADVLKREFTTLAALALEPLLMSANRYLEGLQLEPLSSVGLDLGRWKGETWVPFDLFSGGEKALATCAIQAALAETGPADWRIAYLDEFNTVSGGDNRAIFLRNLAAQLSTGAITQAIVLDNREPTGDEFAAAEADGIKTTIHRLL